MEPSIKNEVINEIFNAPYETFAEKWSQNQLDWKLYLKHVRENKTEQYVTSTWTYYERVRARSHLTPNEFQLVTINALNILARLTPAAAANGLVYGEVQSGKTTSMIVLAALAFDLGFKAVVLVSGRINILRNQTQSRSQHSMAEDDGSPSASRNVTPTRKRKRSSEYDLIDFGDDTESEEEEEYTDNTWPEYGETFLDDHMFWLTADDKDVQNVKDINVDELMRSTKLFAVLKKVPKSLESFVSFIEGDFKCSPWKRASKSNPEIIERKSEIKKKLAEFLSGPALIIDDECDDASVAATQRQLENAKSIPKRMYRIRNMWPKNGGNVCHYVGYSATPQANVLNNANDEFFPDFFWELSTQKGLYLGSQMYLDEELKKKIIKIIPYEDYPNLDRNDLIQPGGEKRGQNAIQTDFLQSLSTEKKTTLSMKKFLAYYVFTGAIRIQRSLGPLEDLKDIMQGRKGSSDPLSFFAQDADLVALRKKLRVNLRKSKEPYHHSLSFDQLNELFDDFDNRVAEMLHMPSYAHSIVLAKIEELIPYRVTLYTLEDGTYHETTSGKDKTRPGFYLLYHNNLFYRVDGPLPELKPAAPLYHSAMVHASHLQDFIDMMHDVVTVAWSIVSHDITNQLNGVQQYDYLNEVWHDVSPNKPMKGPTIKKRIEEVLNGTQIKTAMCRGGESRRNMRTFDYSVAEGDRTVKNKPVPRLLIVIGGNMLSRGLTIEGLTVSWYTRASRQRVADTTIQHQRWFGWRNGYIDLVRVFMQDRHVEVFTEAVKCELNLREVFRRTALNNWRPDRRSALLQQPVNGRLTNKMKHNVEEVRLRTLELKEPVFAEDASRSVLEATVGFWKELAASARQHRAGNVTLNVPIKDVKKFLKQIDVLGVPNVSALRKQLKVFRHYCKRRHVEPIVNVAVPTLGGTIPQGELEEFTDESSQFILQHRLGLHRRKRNNAITNEFKQLLGGKSQVNRYKHQYIDAVADDKNALPEWIITRDTDGNDPVCRGTEAPALLLIYFLHPRFRGKDEDPYPKDEQEVPISRYPLVALAGCFPNVKTSYVANKTVQSSNYIFPEDEEQEQEEPQRKRARIEPLIVTEFDY